MSFTRAAIAGAGLACLVAGCATPAEKFHADAARRGLQRQERMHENLPNVIYRSGEPIDGRPIHFYLDGDGTPWVGGNRVARDPTARNRLILDLIEADNDTSLLIGRPCYYQKDVACDRSLWTARRYAPEVVDVIATAINATIRRYPNSPIVVIGYSGGGTLAALAAPSLVRVDALITIAANLDVAAWAAHHDYTPLAGSLNPAGLPPLDDSIRQFYFYGSEDTAVPVEVARDVVERQAGASLQVIEGYDHHCCWANDWDRILEGVRSNLHVE